MWTIKRRHQHIKAETLSEYLDGRIKGPALGRLDRQLAACGLCRKDLESLRSTVTLLSELPVEAPSRSFTMAAPPPEPVLSRYATVHLFQRWCLSGPYAGAASVTAILLVVLVSADASGLLSPDGPAAREQPAAAAVVTVAEVAENGSQVSPEAAPALEATEPVAMAAAAPPAEDVDSEQLSIALAAAQDAGVQEEAAATAGMEAREATSPIEPSGPKSGAEPAPPETQTQDPFLATEASVPVEEPETGPAPGLKEKGTALFWRFLEGIAGVLGLLFLMAFAVRWKRARRSGRA